MIKNLNENKSGKEKLIKEKETSVNIELKEQIALLSKKIDEAKSFDEIT